MNPRHCYISAPIRRGILVRNNSLKEDLEKVEDYEKRF